MESATGRAGGPEETHGADEPGTAVGVEDDGTGADKSGTASAGMDENDDR